MNSPVHKFLYIQLSKMKHNQSHEIAHSARLAQNADHVWHFDTKAGIYRADRKARLMIKRLGLKPGLKVLEIGCGTGEYTKRIARSNADIVAIDISPELLEVAKDKQKDVTFKVDDAENLSFKDKSFDVVLGCSIIHHLNIKPVFSEIKRVLKPGGKMMFYEPNMMNPYLMVQKNSKTVKRWTGESPDETAFFRWRLKKFLTKIGFKRIKITPIDYVIPFLPDFFLPMQKPIANFLEAIPVINEFTGMLMIEAGK